MQSQNIYDWIVIGGGITGSALSYELAKLGLKVLLLEKDEIPINATYLSYGGVFYWSGTYELTRQLGTESKEIHLNLTEELELPTDLRETSIIFTISPKDDYQSLLNQYQQFTIVPQVLDPQQAREIEPLLNPNAISKAFLMPYLHINPQKTNFAYQTAFQRQGGKIFREKVIALIQDQETIKGVKTDKNTYLSENTVICAGGLTHSFLKETGIFLPFYFTHTYLLKTPPTNLSLNTPVMSAHLKRLELEKNVVNIIKSEKKINDRIIDAGAIQFKDNSLCLGQISEINSNPQNISDLTDCENQIREEIGKILPSLAHLEGKIYHSLVAFHPDHLALVGKIPNYQGIYLFSGFTSPLVFVPPLARHFAQWVIQGNSPVIGQFSLDSN